MTPSELKNNETGTIAFWQNDFPLPEYPPLTENTAADVCVIGGGIAGLTTAYLLQKEGKRVVLLEALKLCGGQTGRTTAHFSFVLDDRYQNIEKTHGRRGARLAFESHRAAMAKVKQIIASEKIDCDLSELDGYLLEPAIDESHSDYKDLLTEELHAARRVGIDVERLEGSPMAEWPANAYLRFPGQMQLHPLKYLAALTTKMSENGVRIHEHSRVVDVDKSDISKKLRVKTDAGFQINCDSVVVATNSPTNDLFVIHTKQAPYRTYAMGFEIAKGSISPGLYWDTLDPYHYVRLQPLSEKYDLLIVGGEDHKTGQEKHPDTCFDNLEQWTRRNFPQARSATHRWSGQVLEPVDGLAYLGRNPMDHSEVYVITGDSGHGMTHATIGAMLITDQIMHRENEWEAVFDPARISLRKAATFLEENANVAAQYGDWVKLPEHPALADLPAGDGLVYRDGVTPVAAFKTPDGDIQKVSAVCTHLGGIVRWNSVEKSWDCPCHGSRFHTDGTVIEGPAFLALAEHEDKNNFAPSSRPAGQHTTREDRA